MKKLLIVEDDYYILDLYKELFEDSFPDYEIQTALDGEEALYKIVTDYYDIISLDIMLPKFHGLQILEAINKFDIPTGTIIMLSNLGQDHIIQRAKELGAVGDIIKSNNTPDVIADTIADYVKKSDVIESEIDRNISISEDKIQEIFNYAKSVEILE